MENVIDTFTHGLKNMTKNPILFAPMFLYLVANFVLSFVFTAVLVIIILFAVGTESNGVLLGAVGISIFIYTLIYTVLISYFSAGTIGMSKNIISTGQTKFNDMFTYGNKYTIRVIIATFISAILQLISIVFWIPVVYACLTSGYTIESFFDLFINNFDELMLFLTSLLLPALIGFLLTFIYLIIISVLFYFVKYAIIVDDIPVIASFKKSYVLVRQHFWKVIGFIIILCIIMIVVMSVLYGIYFLIALISFSFVDDPTMSLFFSMIQLIYQFIMSLLLLCLSVAGFVWITRFYMVISGQELYTEENLIENKF
jgi:hypothetical protein